MSDYVPEMKEQEPQQEPVSMLLQDLPTTAPASPQESPQLSADFKQKAPLLGKWIFMLFWIHIIGIGVNEIFAVALIATSSAAVGTVGNMIAYGINTIAALVLWKLSDCNNRYHRAAIYQLLGVVFLVPTEFLAANSLPSLLFLIPALVCILLGIYEEFMGHSEVLADVDPILSKKWATLWKWMVLFSLVTPLSTVIALLILAFGLLLAVFGSIGMIVVGILQLVYLYRTAMVFRTPLSSSSSNNSTNHYGIE